MVIGQSQMMLLRAIFCHPWDSVVVFYAEEKNMEQFRQKIVNCAGALNMPIPHLESTLIPPLDQTNSIAKFARELNLDSIRNNIEVNENDMLFYSGTVLHIRCLTTTLNFENILTSPYQGRRDSALSATPFPTPFSWPRMDKEPAEDLTEANVLEARALILN